MNSGNWRRTRSCRKVGDASGNKEDTRRTLYGETRRTPCADTRPTADPYTQKLETDSRAMKRSGDPLSNLNSTDSPCTPRVSPRKFEG